MKNMIREDIAIFRCDQQTIPEPHNILSLHEAQERRQTPQEFIQFTHIEESRKKEKHGQNEHK